MDYHCPDISHNALQTSTDTIVQQLDWHDCSTVGLARLFSRGTDCSTLGLVRFLNSHWHDCSTVGQA